MIRKATAADLSQIEEIYHAILDLEEKTVSYTNWKKGLYPTKEDARLALEAGTLYVGEDASGRLYGCVNLNHIQPKEYAEIPWRYAGEGEEILVIHTLCIHPDCKGHGYGRAFVAFAEELAVSLGVKAIRLDTYEGNQPAAALYESLGYKIVGKTLFHFQNVIWETLICMDKKM